MVVDSSVWIEILRDGPLAKKCNAAIHRQSIRVPTLVLHEVYKKLRQKISEDVALEAVAALSRYEILDLTRAVAIRAGDLAVQFKLGTADSIVLAHAEILGEPLITLDNDFVPIAIAEVIR